MPAPEVEDGKDHKHKSKHKKDKRENRRDDENRRPGDVEDGEIPSGDERDGDEPHRKKSKTTTASDDRRVADGGKESPREREPNGKASHGKERSRSRSRSGSRSRDRKRDRKDRDRRSRSRDRERRDRRGSREREREKERERDREREREKEQREKDQRDRERRDSGRDRRSRSRDRDRRDSGRGGGRDDRDSRRREEDRDRDSRRDERDKRDEKRASTSENKKSAEEAKREEEEYQRNIEAQMETLDPEQEAARIEEERRKKREAIMAKHKQKQEDPAAPSNVAGLRQSAVDEPTVKREPTDSTKGFWANSKQVALEDKSSELSAREAELKRKLLASDTFKPAPAPVTISKLPPKFMEEAEEELDEASTTAKAPFRLAKEGEDEEYDEIIEEKMKNESRTGAMKESDLSGLDMFSASPSGGLEEAKKIDVDVYVNEDNWDDADGYYNTRSNEIMNDRYEIVSSRGKGVFSTVLFAKDIKADDNIRAIKMIRANDVMYRAGQKEIKIANSLSADDPHNKKHIVRLLEHFEHKGHLCMVFEPMYMNLREVLRQFGRGVGININAVQAYSKQLFIALQHMKNHGIIHCDLKPDNILVNRQKNLIRVCDLGSAMYLTEVEITPYVCSRFYRPPEVILGLPYDCSLDMWSIACCIFELFTGKIMFQGRTNNHMLKLHQEIKGKIPQKMVRKGVLGETYFDEEFKFMSEEVDPLSKQEVIKRILYVDKPNKDLKSELLGSNDAPVGEEAKKLTQLVDLLDKALILDPARRLTVQQALAHPFLK